MRASTKRGSAGFLAVIAAVLAGGWPVGASARGTDAAIDAQTRWPSLARGDLALVRGAGTLPRWETGVGLDVDLVRRPVVLEDRAVERERDLVETRVTGTFLYGLGLGEGVQATVALPAIWQEGEGRAAATRRPGDALPAAALGDIRLDFAWALGARSREGPAAGEVAWVVASGLLLPTGDEQAFAGAGVVSGYLEGAAETRVGPVRLQGQLGVRMRETRSLGDVRWGSQALGAGAVAVDFWARRLTLAAEAQLLVGLHRKPALPAQGLLEARLALGERREADLGLAAGLGFNDEVASPAFEAVLSLRYIPGSTRATPEGP